MTDLATETKSRPVEAARLIRMHGNDNVAIVANDLGLPAGAEANGLSLRERVPQGHKVALADTPKGAPVRRYDVLIGFAADFLPAGSWVNESRLEMPQPRSLEGLPLATRKAPPFEPLEGYSFKGFRNADGSVGTRNLLAITTTLRRQAVYLLQCQFNLESVSRNERQSRSTGSR